jgi:hypothetical protein
MKSLFIQGSSPTINLTRMNQRKRERRERKREKGTERG